MGSLRTFSLIVLATAALGGQTPTANADPIFFSTRAAFNAAVPGLPVETFENNLQPNNTVTVFSEPLNSASNNAAFAPGSILPGISVSVNPGTSLVLLTQGFLGAPSDVVGPNFFAEDLVLDFVPAVNAVGLDLLALLNPGLVSVNVFGSGGQLGSLPLVLAAAPTFFGVVSTSDPVTRITVTEPGVAVGELADNVAFGNAAGVVPEPTSLALFGVASLCLLVYARR